MNLDSNVHSIVDSTIPQRAFARLRKIKMASIGTEYSGSIQSSLVSQAKENINRLPRYLSILVSKKRFFAEFWERARILILAPQNLREKPNWTT
jgi:hypothetical protein